jgi:hypothetical protein
MSSDHHHSAREKTRLTKGCGIDQTKHFTRYDPVPHQALLGIQEKFDGHCDPTVGLLSLRPINLPKPGFGTPVCGLSREAAPSAWLALFWSGLRYSRRCLKNYLLFLYCNFEVGKTGCEHLPEPG